MLKPKYIENILSITKEKCGEIECDVVCECGAKHFIGYKNVIVRSAEEAAYETDEETYSNSFGWITIKAVNIKTKAKKILLDMETQ